MTLVAMPLPEAAPAPPLANGADVAAAAAGPDVTGQAAALVLAPRENLPPIRRYPEETIEKTRQLVEGTTLSFPVIAERVGISRTTVSNWTQKFGWKRSAGAPPLTGPRPHTGGEHQQAKLISRLHRTFSKQLTALEKRATTAAADWLEKDARTLGLLAKTLETLISLDPDDGAKVNQPEPADRDELDAELARKIEKWARGGTVD